MGHKFTEQIKQWLEKPETERDYNVGALYLLKRSGKAEFIEYQLQKYYNLRVQALRHAQVEEMAAQVATIADEHQLTDDSSTVPEDERRPGMHVGRYALPNKIRAKYVAKLCFSNVCT